MRVITREGLQRLLGRIAADGYTLIGPQVRDGAIVYDTIAGVDDLPQGWGDRQEAGTYRLIKRGDQALFGYTAAAQSWKRFLFPPRTVRWYAEGGNDKFEMVQIEPDTSKKFAFIGVRSCEIAAIEIQDAILNTGASCDPVYRSVRESALIVAVNCSTPSATCFCASMQTGPRAKGGFDIALTEIVGPRMHYFVCESGSDRGAAILDDIESQPATDEERAAAAAVSNDAAKHMGRKMQVEGLRDAINRSIESDHWTALGARCLSCGNCTSVCPTCFCSTVRDVTDLAGTRAERQRVWDSCFTSEFSYIFGGSIRKSVQSRYRQWYTHKFSTWVDQFGVTGCVGCGRCITWCPVGIDVTEEAKRLHNKIAAGPVGQGA